MLFATVFDWHLLMAGGHSGGCFYYAVKILFIITGAECNTALSGLQDMIVKRIFFRISFTHEDVVLSLSSESMYVQLHWTLTSETCKLDEL